MRAHNPLGAVVGCRLAPWVLLTSLVVTGCGPTTPLDKAGLSISPGAGWTSIPTSSVVAPGEVIAAWSGPENSSLTVYTGLPVPGPDPEGFAKETVTLLQNMPGITEATASAPTIAGGKAARVDVLGMGDGRSFAPSGMGTPIARDGKPPLPTRKVAITFLRPGDTLTIAWHFPESARATVEPFIAAALAGLSLKQNASSTHTY
jgi:hypothetical protein